MASVHDWPSIDWPLLSQNPCQLVKTVSQCPRPARSNIFESQFAALLKKSDAQLNQAIKKQDFASCMELKGRMETIRQMSERASNGENVAEEIESLTKSVNS